MTAEIIRSRSHPLFRRLRSLKQRGDDELCLLEGITLLEEALDAGTDIQEVATSLRLERADRGRRLMTRTRDRGIPARVLDETLLASLSEVENSQGVLAL